MEFKDYYQTLAVERGATPDELKRSYRRLARKFHPDVSDEPDAEDRFKEVQEAYEVLKDPEKRSAYDRFGANWKAGEDFRPPPGWEYSHGPHPGSDGGFSQAGFSDSADFSEFFESLFGGAPPQGPRGPGGRSRGRGEDQHARVVIPLEDAFAGTTRSLSLQVPEVDEGGRVAMRTRTLNVKIPSGVTQGQRIRLAGQGAPGLAGAGDLYLEVVMEPHRLYRVDGRDVYVDLPVTPWEAALGETVTVPTLGGKVDLRIPAGSQSGAKLRLKGRGLPGSPAGDQFVTLEIMAPRAETDAARALYAQMKREMPFDPRENLGG